MIILGIETSCDDTAVAILKKKEILISKKYIQPIHSEYGGVVPELASREHISKIYNLVNDALNESGIDLNKIDLFSVTKGPGLIGSLLVGYIFAKTLSYTLNKPLVGVNHLEGHIYAGLLNRNDLSFPFISLIISGGNTILLRVDDHFKYKLLGQTRDDAAGEAIDKVGTMIGLKYPAGPEMEKLAKNKTSDNFSFPKPSPSGYDFSYSGLKTAVLYTIKKMTSEDIREQRENIASAFLNSLSHSLIDKVVLACVNEKMSDVLVTGGVAVNSLLQNEFNKVLEKYNIKTYYPDNDLCGDNAAMIAYLGYERYCRLNETDNLDSYPDPRMKLF